MGLEGVPEPGDVLNVVENENRAREVAELSRARQEATRTAGGGKSHRHLARTA